MKKFVVANWKMNPGTSREALSLFRSVKNGFKNLKNIEIIICPPSIYIAELVKDSGNIKIGAQNLFWENPPKGGAFTGEISAKQLKALGCEFVIVGHSERKIHFGETNSQINKKIKLALKYGMRPILLFGENTIEKKNKQTKKVILGQIKECLAEIKKSDLAKIILAYEPVWAIGGESACFVEDVYEINLFLKNLIAKEYSVNLAEKIPVLYGGSVNSKNAFGYIADAMSDGVLVGSASLSSLEFIKIAKSLSKSR